MLIWTAIACAPVADAVPELTIVACPSFEKAVTEMAPEPEPLVDNRPVLAIPALAPGTGARAAASAGESAPDVRIEPALVNTNSPPATMDWPTRPPEFAPDVVTWPRLVPLCSAPEFGIRMSVEPGEYIYVPTCIAGEFAPWVWITPLGVLRSDGRSGTSPVKPVMPAVLPPSVSMLPEFRTLTLP